MFLASGALAASSVEKNVGKWILAMLSVLCGCQQAIEVKPIRKQWDQACEKCGRQFTVERLDGGEVPPTTEWCFFDGSYCEEGLAMVIDVVENGESPERTKAFIDHCRQCFGCRAAAYDPDEWHAIEDGAPQA